MMVKDKLVIEKNIFYDIFSNNRHRKCIFFKEL